MAGPKILNGIFLEAVKSTSFLFIRSFRQSNRNSEGSRKKLEIPKGKRGEQFWNLESMGVGHFGVS